MTFDKHFSKETKFYVIQNKSLLIRYLQMQILAHTSEFFPTRLFDHIDFVLSKCPLVFNYIFSFIPHFK